MSLLELERVSARSDTGVLLLDGVSMSLEAGELAVIWGRRGSGRSSLLRIAAGVQPPEQGVVRFDGRKLSHRPGAALGRGVGFAHRTVNPHGARSVLEQLVLALLAHGERPARARETALRALDRTGVTGCAAMRPGLLDTAEAVRVAIARAIALSPRLLVVHEPTSGVEVLERDPLIGLLRGLADEGMAVLASAREAAAIASADRSFALGEGRLRPGAQPGVAQVLPLRRRTGAGGL